MHEDSEKQPLGRQSPDGARPNMTLRMVLVGKTGAGKSSSGNTILGEKVFSAAKRGSSITKECCKETREVAGRQVVLVDTPGLFATDLSDTDLKLELSRCINMTAPGPHAIILVIQLGPFTTEERQTVEKIRAFFGQDADQYTMVLFTHGDELTDTIEEYIDGANRNLKDVISRYGGRYHVFNNTEMQDRLQVLELLEKIDKMTFASGAEYYTSKMYQDVEHTLRLEEERLREYYKQKLHEQERALESRFEEERRNLQDSIDALREHDKEKDNKIQELKHLDTQNKIKITEFKRFYEKKLKAVRREAERSQLSEELLKQVLNKLKLTAE